MESVVLEAKSRMVAVRVCVCVFPLESRGSVRIVLLLLFLQGAVAHS